MNMFRYFVVITVLCIITLYTGSVAFAQYSVMDRKSPAEIYFVNGVSIALPVYLRLPSDKKSNVITVEAEGLKTLKLTVSNSVAGWELNGTVLSSGNNTSTIAINFETGDVFAVPADLSEKIDKSITVEGRLAINGLTTPSPHPQDLELVIVDISALRQERTDKFLMIVSGKSPSGMGISKVNLTYTPSKSAFLGANADVNGVNIVNRPLINAAANGQSDLTKKLIDAGTNINETDPDTGDNALMKSIKSGAPQMSTVLIDGGIKTTHVNRYGQTALHLAAEQGYYDISEKLISSGVGVNSKDSNDNSVLTYAAVSVNPQVLDMLVKRGAKVNDTNKDGRSPIAFAAFNGNTRNVDILIANKANVGQVDNDGNSILMDAVKGGNAYAVKSILSAGGASIDYPDNMGNTPLEVSILRDDNLIATMLVDGKADINRKNKDGDTALMLAAAKNNKLMVNKLLEASADLYVENNAGKTAYDLASSNPSIQRMIMQVTKNSDEMASSLFAQVSAGDRQKAEELIKRGSRVNASDLDTGNTPLFAAVSNNYKDMVTLLLKNGAEVNWQNKRGNTPLMVGVASGDEKMIEILLGGGGDPNIQNFSGDTALMWAVKLQRMEIVRTLLLGKANPNIKNYESATPLNVAISEGLTDIERLLRSFGGY